MQRLIAFSARKQHGKDTSADFVMRKLLHNGASCKKIGFADPLKRFCMDSLGLTHNQVYGTDEQKNTLTNWKWEGIDPAIRVNYSPVNEYMTAREVMQIVGTDLMRDKFNRDIWARAAINIARNSKEDFIIFNDTRFINEVQAAKKENGLIIRLHRKNHINNDEHWSEKALDKYPNWIYNYYVEADNSDVDGLLKQIDDIMIHEGIYGS